MAIHNCSDHGIESFEADNARLRYDLALLQQDSNSEAMRHKCTALREDVYNSVADVICCEIKAGVPRLVCLVFGPNMASVLRSFVSMNLHHTLHVHDRYCMIKCACSRIYIHDRPLDRAWHAHKLCRAPYETHHRAYVLWIGTGAILSILQVLGCLV